jgi:benzodiazapine receptor
MVIGVRDRRVEPPMPPVALAAPRRLSWLALIGWIALCQAAGGPGRPGHRGDPGRTTGAWYRELARPTWAPPGWLFGPVWLTLYTAMAVAAWLVWRGPSSPARRAALAWFGVQLALNAAWSPTFFGLRSLGGGLIVIVALLVAIAVTIARFAPRSRLAAGLLTPYLAWVAFATALNAALWSMN